MENVRLISPSGVLVTTSERNAKALRRVGFRDPVGDTAPKRRGRPRKTGGE